MAWSLDFFAAEKLARAGAQIRRVAWTDRVLVKEGALWFFLTDSGKTVITTTDYAEEDLRARDWTDQPFNANPCEAVPAYNTSPIVYSSWEDKPVFTAPPVPGFPDA